MVDLSVDLFGKTLINPVMTASGTFGFGEEFSNFYDLNVLGGISVKGTTKELRFGNNLPRIAEVKSGILNSVGLQNPGIDNVLAKHLPQLRRKYKNIIMLNIGGFDIAEFVECIEKADKSNDFDFIELNISCPNLHNNGKNFGVDKDSAALVVKNVRKLTKKPIVVKLTPNVTDITEIAKAVEAEGADGISLINTLLGMKIDIKTRRPILANKMGGYSGDGVFPVAVRCVYQVANAVKVPVIGMGGISTAKDVIEMMMAGATAVEVGTANLINPYVSKEIVENLPMELENIGVKNIREIIGVVK